MKRIYLFVFFAIASAITTWAGDLTDAIDDATSILSAKQDSENPIPQAILQQAKAVGIIGVTKGAFGIGGADGEGVILVRTRHGWSNPIAFDQGGGSVGLQIGVDVKRYIYVFNTNEAWRAFTGPDHVQFRAAANATAGPDSSTTASSNGLPTSNLYVYTISDGAYVGAAIGGESVGNDKETNLDEYGTWRVDEILHLGHDRPLYSHRLYNLLSAGGK